MKTEEPDLKKWLLQVRDGNNSALGHLFEALRRPLFSFLYRLTGQAEEAEDLLQDTFIAIFRGVASWDSSRAVLPWTFTIARNRFLETRRSAGRVIRLEKVWAARRGHADPGFAASSELRADLERGLATLSEPVRETFVLKHFQEFTFTEVAEIQSLPLTTVKSRVLFAVRKLRGLTNGEGHDG